MRHGHFLVLSSKFKNISIYSFFVGVFYLSIFLSRSRTDENTYEDDFFCYKEELEGDIEQATTIDSYAGNDSTSLEVDFEAHYSVEEQLHISGFFIDNNLCSMSSFDDYIQFSYAKLYEQLSGLYNSVQLFFFSRYFYYFFFLSFFIYVRCIMLFKHCAFHSYIYFISDYSYEYY